MLCDIHLAHEAFRENIEKSAQKHWPGCDLRRIRRPGTRGYYVFSIGVFKDGQLIAYAKVKGWRQYWQAVWLDSWKSLVSWHLITQNKR